MVTGYVYNACTVVGECNNFSQHLVVTFWPEERAFHGPQVDDITDQVKGVGLGIVQEIQQIIRFAVPVPQVNVG